MRRILRILGLTPLRSKRRVTKYNPGNVQQWKEEDFPRISKRSKELGAAILFADESGLDSHCV